MKKLPPLVQQACADLSAQTPNGRFWTWNMENKNCIVKSSDAVRSNVPHAVSGNRKCGTWVRLESEPAGRVNLFLNGEWGTLCGHGWLVRFC